MNLGNKGYGEGQTKSNACVLSTEQKFSFSVEASAQTMTKESSKAGLVDLSKEKSTRAPPPLLLKLMLLSTKLLAFPPRESAAHRSHFFSTGQCSRGGFWMRIQQRNSPSQQSLRLAPHTATVWEGTVTIGTVHQSACIAAIPSVGRDYLPAQREIIAVCCWALESRFKVHVPWQGVTGSLSHIKLATFAKFTHTVYGFLLGKQGGIWLCQDNKSGRYCFGYCTWGYLPGRVANEVGICDIVEWVATRGY